jgi:hypothetical protein
MSAFGGKADIGKTAYSTLHFEMAYKPLILRNLLVGAQGLEPWTR